MERRKSIIPVLHFLSFEKATTKRRKTRKRIGEKETKADMIGTRREKIMSKFTPERKLKEKKRKGKTMEVVRSGSTITRKKGITEKRIEKKIFFPSLTFWGKRKDRAIMREIFANSEG